MKNKTILDRLPMDKSSVFNANGSVRKIDPATKIFLCVKCKNHYFMPELHAGNVCKSCHAKRVGDESKTSQTDRPPQGDTVEGVGCPSTSDNKVDGSDELDHADEQTRGDASDSGEGNE